MNVLNFTELSLLYITYTVDKLDCNAGHVHDWIKVLAPQFKHINVICIKKGNKALPKNVTVFSIGKERGFSKFRQIISFFIAAINCIGKSNIVFCQFSTIFVFRISFLFTYNVTATLIIFYGTQH